MVQVGLHQTTHMKHVLRQRFVAKMLNVGFQFLRIPTEIFEPLRMLAASCGILWLLLQVPSVDDVEAVFLVH